MGFIKRQLMKLTNDAFLFCSIMLLSIVFLFGTGFCYQDWSAIASNQLKMPLVFFMESLWIVGIYFSICAFAWIFMFINIFTKQKPYINLVVSISSVFVTIFTYYIKLIY